MLRSSESFCKENSPIDSDFWKTLLLASLLMWETFVFKVCQISFACQAVEIKLDIHKQNCILHFVWIVPVKCWMDRKSYDGVNDYSLFSVKSLQRLPHHLDTNMIFQRQCKIQFCLWISSSSYFLKKVIFYFQQHVVRHSPEHCMHWAVLSLEITPNRWKDSKTKILLSSADIQTNVLLWIWDWAEEWMLYQMQAITLTQSISLS